MAVNPDVLLLSELLHVYDALFCCLDEDES